MNSNHGKSSAANSVENFLAPDESILDHRVRFAFENNDFYRRAKPWYCDGNVTV